MQDSLCAQCLLEETKVTNTWETFGLVDEQSSKIRTCLVQGRRGGTFPQRARHENGNQGKRQKKTSVTLDARVLQQIKVCIEGQTPGIVS